MEKRILWAYTTVKWLDWDASCCCYICMKSCAASMHMMTQRDPFHHSLSSLSISLAMTANDGSAGAASASTYPAASPSACTHMTAPSVYLVVSLMLLLLSTSVMYCSKFSDWTVLGPRVKWVLHQWLTFNTCSVVAEAHEIPMPSFRHETCIG